MITAAASRHAATARTLRHTPLRYAADRWPALVVGGAAARVSDPEFVDKCRRQYVANGWCHVPMFLPRATCDELRAEAVGLLESEHAFASSDEHTVYQEEAAPRLPPDHARNRLMQSKKRIVDYARIPPQSALRALYTAPQHTLRSPAGTRGPRCRPGSRTCWASRRRPCRRMYAPSILS